MSNGTIRYWISFEEKGGDARPLKLPLPPAVKHWWCSGYGDGTSIVCAVVDVNGTEESAWEALDGFWSPVSKRFAESKGWAKNGWMPEPSRFPVKASNVKGGE